ncbi:hypothetical protein C5167_032188 [Papaver somniferum]|uniref:Uncharacterized protein n=1 Tax=Papaver somniferum TaxID=3469 RepID=A0A4Y7KA79_PAPSO|nr:hypothetical protein C5167_032188 [Papaver somniferum]
MGLGYLALKATECCNFETPERWALKASPYCEQRKLAGNGERKLCERILPPGPVRSSPIRSNPPDPVGPVQSIPPDLIQASQLSPVPPCSKVVSCSTWFGDVDDQGCSSFVYAQWEPKFENRQTHEW